MSPIEWDMWFALTSRERANEKSKPIFQMRECESKKNAQQDAAAKLIKLLKI